MQGVRSVAEYCHEKDRITQLPEHERIGDLTIKLQLAVRDMNASGKILRASRNGIYWLSEMEHLGSLVEQQRGKTYGRVLQPRCYGNHKDFLKALSLYEQEFPGYKSKINSERESNGALATAVERKSRFTAIDLSNVNQSCTTPDDALMAQLIGLLIDLRAPPYFLADVDDEGFITRHFAAPSANDILQIALKNGHRADADRWFYSRNRNGLYSMTTVQSLWSSADSTK